MSEVRPQTLEGSNSPEQMLVLITGLLSELIAQRARIAQLTNVQAPQAAPSPASSLEARADLVPTTVYESGTFDSDVLNEE
jgi:hypothetical protein